MLEHARQRGCLGGLKAAQIDCLQFLAAVEHAVETRYARGIQSGKVGGDEVRAVIEHIIRPGSRYARLDDHGRYRLALIAPRRGLVTTCRIRTQVARRSVAQGADGELAGGVDHPLARVRLRPAGSKRCDCGRCGIGRRCGRSGGRGLRGSLRVVRGRRNRLRSYRLKGNGGDQGWCGTTGCRAGRIGDLRKRRNRGKPQRKRGR